MGMALRNNLFRGLSGIVFGLAAMTAPVAAAVVQSTGAGSAVSQVDAAADFENAASLGGSFVEGGMSFSRVDVSNNNNGCGYAGCSSYFPSFSGNYFYGFGDGHLSIGAAADETFEGLEFNFGWNTNHRITWQAMLDGSIVDTGSANNISGGTILSFSGLFDTLLFTSNHIFTPQLDGFYNTPAVDQVRAQYLPSVVPVPASLPLLLTALLGGAWIARRKRA